MKENGRRGFFHLRRTTQRKMSPTSTTSSIHVARRGDAYSRLSSSSSLGRGSETGWTTCPLCPPKSSRRFALGRGIAAHLHAVHPPWLPMGKKERKRKEAERKKLESMKMKGKKRKLGGGGDTSCVGVNTTDVGSITCDNDTRDGTRPNGWKPTQQEIEEWGRKVAEITAQVEADAAAADGNPCSTDCNSEIETSDSSNNDPSTQPPPRKKRHASAQYVGPGMDRTGGTAVKSYRDSLPPLLAAAADGNIEEMKLLLGEDAGYDDNDARGRQKLLAILNQRDRNGSTAEHWAAGGGHLDCLKMLHRARHRCDELGGSDSAEGGADAADDGQRAISTGAANNTADGKKIRRRRDGKTPLHYAARNGRDNVIKYLLEEQDSSSAVDVPTGDGTTALHLACFSARLSTVKLLIETYGANPNLKNDWGCGTSHWMAMSANTNCDQVVQLCRYLKKEHGISFHERQKQGHSAVHKAAQKKNREVIEWLAATDTSHDEGAGMSVEEKKGAGRPDDGGNRPSDIWDSVGGDPTFSTWMRSECGW